MSGGAARALARRAWARWKVVARAIGNFQARVLLSAFYFLVVPPFALAVKLWSDPLRLRTGGATTGWVERAVSDTSREGVRRQF